VPVPAAVASAVGMLALAIAMLAGSSTPEVVTVIETDYRFEPSTLRLRVNVSYRLHLENRGKELHEFTAPAFFRSVQLGNPAVLNAERTEIVVQPGEQKDLDFVPRQVGRYPMACADHDWAGMTGEIVVE
jgi:uncharacterized cupredoxin-like copper-binding protein